MGYAVPPCMNATHTANEGNKMTSEIIKMQMAKKQACDQIAELIRDYFTGDSMPVTIGIMDDGTIDSAHNVHGLDGMAVGIYDTEDGWTLGDFNGDCEDSNDWTQESLDAVAECFLGAWLDEALDGRWDYVTVIWAE